MSADSRIFIEICIISATNAFIIAYIENRSVRWTIYAGIFCCIIVGCLFWASYQALLHSFVVYLVSYITIVTIKKNILITCVCYKSLFFVLTLTILSVEFQSNRAVLTLKSLKVEIHRIGASYACISIEIRCGCWTGEKG
jgi:hypothetical protein